MSYKFEPWNEVGETKESDKLNITEPPCKHCKFWNPQAIYYPTVDGLRFDSVRLCWAECKHFDFSCFTNKGE